MWITEQIQLARKHALPLNAEHSARFCLAEAIAAHEREDFLAAHLWAEKSLCYSVGIFHPDYQQVLKS